MSVRPWEGKRKESFLGPGNFEIELPRTRYEKKKGKKKERPHPCGPHLYSPKREEKREKPIDNSFYIAQLFINSRHLIQSGKRRGHVINPFHFLVHFYGREKREKGKA